MSEDNSVDVYKKDLEDYFCRFTFGQFVTLILLEIVTLFFVFYLGARYGGDLMGTHQEAKQNSSFPKEGAKSVDEIVGAPVNYTYPEVLTDGKEKALRVKPSGMTAEEFERQSRMELRAQEQAPKEVKKIEEKESPPAIETKPQGKFTVQVGSFPSAEEAASSMNRWKEKGYAAFITVGEIPQKGTWYRVRIGGFPDRKHAEKFLTKFKTKEKVNGLVVPSKS